MVEDNEDLLEVTSAMLTDVSAIGSLCARNGAEAIQMLESGQEFELSVQRCRDAKRNEWR